MVADGRLVHVLPDWADETFPLYVHYHPQALMPAKVRVFLDYLGELAG
jgi:DNA-binding transcriptional LysR family regulator